MRRVFSALLLAALPAMPLPAWADNISVSLDEVRTLTLPAGIAAINVGNPAIADITPMNSRTYFLLGKAYGATNIIAVNKAGEVISNTHVSVLSGQQAQVTLQRGAQRTTYNCTARACEAAPQPGDGKDSFDAAVGQINAHQSAAKQAAAAPSN